MRISDCSSDVCSSDLSRPRVRSPSHAGRAPARRRVCALDLDQRGGGGQYVRSVNDNSHSEFLCCPQNCDPSGADRSEEHTSELQSLMRISYAVFCLTKK